MKKLKNIVFVLFITLFMLSCGGGSSPKSVAKNYMEALAKQDFKTAKELGTERTKGFIAMIEGMMQMMPEEKKEKSFGNFDNISWGEVEIDGDNAVVYFSSKDDKGGEKEKVNLKKVDGKWKVDMKKDL